MEAGVRNALSGEVDKIKYDDIMAEVSMWVGGWGDNTPKITSVMTRDSLQEAGFKEGDKIDALVKAINVVFVKQ